MGRVPFNQEIKDRYEEYEAFLEAPKLAPFSIDVTTKENHPESLMAIEGLTCDNKFDLSSLYIEVRNQSLEDFTFQIMGTNIEGRVLLRYDAKPGGAVHKNNVPYIPLAQQQVDHPHFHKFNQYGHLLAYKTDDMKSNSSRLSQIFDGFYYFCNESNILTEIDNELPVLCLCDWSPNTNSDPNDGVPFP